MYSSSSAMENVAESEIRKQMMYIAGVCRVLPHHTCAHPSNHQPRRRSSWGLQAIPCCSHPPRQR